MLESTDITPELEIAWLRQQYVDLVDMYATLSKQHARLVLEQAYAKPANEVRNETTSDSETDRQRAKRLGRCDFPYPAGTAHCTRLAGHARPHGWFDVTW